MSGFKIAAELISQALALLFHNGRNGRDAQGAFSVCQSVRWMISLWVNGVSLEISLTACMVPDIHLNQASISRQPAVAKNLFYIYCGFHAIGPMGMSACR